MVVILVRQHYTVAWSKILIPCQGVEPGKPGWKPGILAITPARSRSLIFPRSLSPVKNAFIVEAETVNAGTKFIIRHSTTTCGRAHRETICLVEIEGKQRSTPRDKGCGHPPNEEEPSKEVVKLFIWVSSSGPLSFFRPIIWFLFPHLTNPGILPWGAHTPTEVKVSAGSNSLWPGVIPWLLTHKEPFCTCVVSSLSPKREVCRSRNP